MFTAIALVAFSSASMANTIEVEDLSKENLDNKNAITQDTCLDFAIAELELLDPDNTLSPVDAHDYFQGMYDICTIARRTLGIY